MSDGEGPLVEHLFREEAGRLLAALARLLGLHNLALAEDVVQDTLVRALETWRFGVPENPSAWLMRAAKNRALDLIRRERTRRRFAPELGGLTDDERTLAQAVEARFAEHELADDVLRMMFTCCAPRLPGEVQVALVLKLLCGFSAGEIAAAFLASEAAVEKQLQRGRRALAAAGALYEVSGAAAIRERLGAVHQALYLLFNEGYHASRRDEGVREELCHEALRLGHLLAEHPVAGVPSTQALLALMCFHAARLPARLDDQGSLVLLAAQDRSKWDRRLIGAGFRYLDRSATGDELTAFHLEAAIAAKHCVAERFEETDWRSILELYDLLLARRPSPVVALNRAIAVGQLEGPGAGLRALAAVEESEQLAGYPFLLAARADLLRAAGRTAEAAADLRRALRVARNPSEVRVLEAKLAACLD